VDKGNNPSGLAYGKILEITRTAHFPALIKKLKALSPDLGRMPVI
jgi:hypothetical protein